MSLLQSGVAVTPQLTHSFVVVEVVVVKVVVVVVADAAVRDVSVRDAEASLSVLIIIITLSRSPKPSV